MVKFRTAAVFSDNCVLQRNKNIAIFGEAEDGKNIKDYLLHSNNSYDNLNIAQYLKCDLNFNYEQTYNNLLKKTK